VGLPDDAGHFLRVASGVAIPVDAIWNPQQFQTCTQVQKNSHLSSDARLAADYSSNHPSRITIQGQPPVRVGFFVKKVERFHSLIKVQPFRLGFSIEKLQKVSPCQKMNFGVFEVYTTTEYPTKILFEQAKL
jgi:hypothetical protein